MSMSAPLPQDKQGGFYELIIGGIVLAAVLYGIVRSTNSHYAQLEHAKAPAAAAPAP
jgi:hypothetical protein